MILRYFKHFAWTATSWALTTSNDDILVGGQAVVEGVMMRSPKGYSVAVRRQDGGVHVIKDVLQTVGERWPIFKLPFLRGVGVLGQALSLGIKSLKFSVDAVIAEEEAKQNPQGTPVKKETSSWFMAANVVVALGVNILLLFVLPLFLTRLVQSSAGFESSLLFNAVDGLFRVAVFVTFLTAVSRLRDMNRVFQYHGAEHKTVYTFEARESLLVNNAKKYSTLHPRCGTSFLMVVMVVSIIVFTLVSFDSIAAKLLSRIVLLPLIAGISYEVIRYSAKHPGSFLRLVTFPGLMLQKITTKEPDEKQLEVAIRALEEALSV